MDIIDELARWRPEVAPLTADEAAAIWRRIVLSSGADAGAGDDDRGRTAAPAAHRRTTPEAIALDGRREPARRWRWLTAAAAVALVVVGAVAVARRAQPSEAPVIGSPPSSAVATTATGDPTTATTVPVSVVAPPTTAGSASTLPKAVVPVLALGDSVMQGVQAVLPDHGITVDANESIQGKGLLEELRAVLASTVVTEAAVIQVGTNGPVTQEQYDEMANLLVGVPKVFFMTIKAPRDWVAGNNEKIRALPSTHPNVQVIDWEAQGATIEGELSQSDGGIHLNSGTAVRFYANLILSALGRPTIPEPTG